MKLQFLGACREVGRAGLAVKVGDRHLLLDYGVMMDHGVGFPVHIPLKEIDAIVLTHAHLDHSGMIPLFYIRGKIPAYGVEPTFDLSDLLIKDFIHLSGYYLPYEYIDLQSMITHCLDRSYGSEFNVDKAKVTLLKSGHIPGGSQVLIEYEGKRVLYTSDFNRAPTRLLDGADQPPSDLDAVVIESTYADEDHADRVKIEEEFVAKATEVVKRGGAVLVPAFGVGRSQEILSVLSAHNFKYPVFVDGMAREAIQITLKHREALRDPELFSKAVEKAEWIEKWGDRRRAAKTPSVIVSPAGMLQGGAAVFYMDAIARRAENAILLVSYQIPGTPGRVLLEQKKFIIRGEVKPVKAEIERYDFSSHSGKSELEATLSKLNGKTKVFVVHGAEGNCERLADWASKELGLEAVAPRPGETYEV